MNLTAPVNQEFNAKYLDSIVLILVPSLVKDEILDDSINTPWLSQTNKLS